uniref:(northern house mosquito) hypothetical protein n=1 Tax=Culex pipiens TaxID=7175 RepID=A0A8D8A4Y4_CULPI
MKCNLNNFQKTLHVRILLNHSVIFCLIYWQNMHSYSPNLNFLETEKREIRQLKINRTAGKDRLPGELFKYGGRDDACTMNQLHALLVEPTIEPAMDRLFTVLIV